MQAILPANADNQLYRDVCSLTVRVGWAINIVRGIGQGIAGGAHALAKRLEKPGSIWSSTRDKSSIQNAFSHWKSHKKDFPELQNSKQYVQYARDFRNQSNVLEKFRQNYSATIILSGSRQL